MVAESPESSQPLPAEAAPRSGGRRKFVVLALAAVLLAVALAALRWVLNPTPPPLWGVLPPQADLYVYADMQALRTNPAVRWYLQDGPALLGAPANPDADPDADLDNETQRFVQATGFRYQDHLHQVAAARQGGNWVGAARISAHRQRLEDYLKSRATSIEQMAATSVYSFGRIRPLRVALTDGDVLLFSIGTDDGELARAMLRLAQPPDRDGAFATLAQSLPPVSAGEWRAVLERALWVVGDGEKLLNPADESAQPTLGGFMLGEETLRGIQTLLVSVESGTLSLNLEGELLCKPGVDPKPLAENLSLLASLMRPRAPEPGGRDYRVLWDAINISAQQSSVLIRWQPTPQMLHLLTANGK